MHLWWVKKKRAIKTRLFFFISWLSIRLSSVSQGARHRLKGSVNAVRIRAPQIGGERSFLLSHFYQFFVFIVLFCLLCPPGTSVWFKESTQTIFDLNFSIVSHVPLVIMLLIIKNGWQGLGFTQDLFNYSLTTVHSKVFYHLILHQFAFAKKRCFFLIWNTAPSSLLLFFYIWLDTANPEIALALSILETLETPTTSWWGSCGVSCR